LHRRIYPARLLIPVLAPAAAAGIGFLLSLQGKAGAVGLFVLAVALATFAAGLWGGLVAGALSYLGLTYWFLEPMHSFAVRKEGAAAVVLLGTAAVSVSVLLARERRAARRAQKALEAREKALGIVAGSHRLATRLSAAVTASEVAEVLVEELPTAVPCDGAWISALSQVGGELELLAQQGFAEVTVRAFERIPVDAPNPAAQVFRDGEPRWYRSAEEFSRLHPELARIYADAGVEAMALLPLAVGSRPMGFVALRFAQPRPFLPAERRLLGSWARQGSEALVRARLYESEREARESADEARKLAARLQRTTADLAAAVDLAEVAEVVVGELSAALGAVAGWLSLVDDSGRMLELVASHGYSRDFVERYRRVPLDAPLAVAEVVREGTSAWLEKASAETEYPELQEATEATTGDGLAIVPLRSAGRTFGFVALRFWESGTFSDAERTLVQTLADQCAQSLERARLYDREHRIALTLQQSVLPDDLPVLEAVELAGRYFPGATEGQVGGDWYDIIELPRGGIAAVVGDVVGKGIAAASAMAQLRNALRAFAQEGYKPSTILNRVNRLARSAGFSFATLLYLVLDPDTGWCRFASAGHLPPLVVRDDGSAWFGEGGRSLPIGVADDTTYRQATLSLAPGWTVLLFTDGLIERRGESLEQGFARLQEVACRAGPDPEPLLDAVVERMLPGGALADDVALLAVRPVAVPAPSLRLRVPSEAAQLASVRRSLRGWLLAAGSDPEVAEEIVLAVSEACANAMEHPRSPRERFVEVEASATDGVVSLLVRDSGRWRPLVSTAERGRGLRIIEQLMDRVERSESDDGTELRLVRSLGNGAAR
jgi:serine phosphatase RsbU (regulator of sigma subunit)/anti-sigma regulatory factor (Ser/Thr protein kinase)